ncbi:fused MFS/spermidine synthase [candidate division KSB1 bacterium]|nr:fused MFS/spermidine synthase [candidate division KSB1 bacterium]
MAQKPYLSKQTLSLFGPSGILHLVFFLSGMAGLIYQLVWLRMLGLVFGVTVFAVSTVLTAFMAGIALGSLVWGRIADRIQRPILLLLFFEIVLALYALAFPKMLALLMTSAHHLASPEATSLAFRSMIRFILSFALLLIPASIIGGGLPVVGKVLIRSSKRIGTQISGLYAVYHAGAFLGCFLAGFFLIRMLGMQGTVTLGIALNVFNGFLLFSFVLKKSFKSSISASDTGLEETEFHPPANLPKHRIWIAVLLTALILEGFCATAYEVTWMRMLGHFSADKSLVMTSTLFCAFLFGLFAGSLLVKRWIDRSRRLILLLGWIEAMIGLSALLIAPLLLRVGTQFMTLRMHYPESWWATLGREYGIFFSLLLIPVILMGMTFPIFSRLLCDSIQHLGRRLGGLGFLDTAGSILGAFIAGFLFIPKIGMFRSSEMIALISVGVGVVLILMDSQSRHSIRIAMVLAILLGVGSLQQFNKRQSDWPVWQGKKTEDHLVFHAEGPAAIVSAFDILDGERRLAINGSLSAFGESDLVIDKMRGLIPTLLHPKPRKALTVGLGMGVAARSLLLPEIERLDCVELSKTVSLASDSCYHGVNDRIAHNSRFNLIFEDGRNYLQYTDSTYDVISSNSIHARFSPFLYTKEFYALCANRLNPGGILCQWLTTNWMTESEFKGLISAFVSVFPHAQLYSSGISNLILVGSGKTITVDYDRWQSAFSHPDMQHLVADSLLLDPLDVDHLIARFICGDDALHLYSDGTSPESDDRTSTEFSRVVKPVVNPAIVQSFIQLKVRSAPLLKKVDNLYLAELAYLAGDLAFNYLGQREAGIESLHEAVQRDPDSFRYRDALSSYLRIAGRIPEAIEVLLPLTTRRSDARLYRYLGMLYLESGQIDQAEQALRSPAEQGDILSQYFLGLTLMQKSRAQDALEWIQILLSVRPEFLDARFQLGLVHLMLGQSGEASEAFQSCLDQDYRVEEILQIVEQVPELKLD